MAKDTLDDLNDTGVEAPGGTQATHSSTGRLERGPRVRMIAPVVRRVGQAADAGASYVRNTDIMTMHGDLERGIREHPLKSIAIALGCGYLLSKLID